MLIVGVAATKEEAEVVDTIKMLMTRSKSKIAKELTLTTTSATSIKTRLRIENRN